MGHLHLLLICIFFRSVVANKQAVQAVPEPSCEDVMVQNQST